MARRLAEGRATPLDVHGPAEVRPGDRARRGSRTGERDELVEQRGHRSRRPDPHPRDVQVGPGGAGLGLDHQVGPQGIGRRRRPLHPGGQHLGRRRPGPVQAELGDGRRREGPEGQRGDDAEVAPSPPWLAHRRSLSVPASAVTRRPSAVTIWTAVRLSQVNPWSRSTTPTPPPRVRPAMPDRRARARRDRHTLPVERAVHVDQPGAGADRRARARGRDLAESGHVDHEAARDGRVPRVAVATAAGRQGQAVVPGEGQAALHVRRRGAVRHRGRPHRVETGVVELDVAEVAGVGGPHQSPGQPGGQPGPVRGGRRRRRGCPSVVGVTVVAGAGRAAGQQHAGRTGQAQPEEPSAIHPARPARLDPVGPMIWAPVPVGPVVWPPVPVGRVVWPPVPVGRLVSGHRTRSGVPGWRARAVLVPRQPTFAVWLGWLILGVPWWGWHLGPVGPVLGMPLWPSDSPGCGPGAARSGAASALVHASGGAGHAGPGGPGSTVHDRHHLGDGRSAALGGDVGGADQVAMPGQRTVGAAEVPPFGFGDLVVAAGAG